MGVLEAEEVTLTYNWCGVCNGETRRPYGELGSVDKGNCLCCVGVASGLTKDQPLCPGSGCNEPFVAEIVSELKTRMRSRGDTGQISRTEAVMAEVRGLRGDVDLIMA